jgi:hypothetical protein
MAETCSVSLVETVLVGMKKSYYTILAISNYIPLISLLSFAANWRFIKMSDKLNGHRVDLLKMIRGAQRHRRGDLHPIFGVH